MARFLRCLVTAGDDLFRAQVQAQQDIGLEKSYSVLVAV